MAQGYGKGYDTPEDAAAGASQLLERQPNAKGLEYAAVIFHDKRDGKFYRTQLGTSNQPGQAQLANLFAGLDENQVPVAVLHNHPGGPRAAFDPKFLSDADTAVGKGVQYNGRASGPMQMYLLTGNELRQGTGQMQKTMGMERTPYYLQSTTPTLAQFPIEELIQYVNSRSPFARAAAAARQAPNPMLAAGGQ